MKNKTAQPLFKQTKQLIELLKSLWNIKLTKVLAIILLLIIVVPLGIFIVIRPVPQKNINYGINYSKKYTEQMKMDWKYTFLKIVDELKVKNMRLVAYWDDSEPSNNRYDFSDVIWQLDEAKKRNINVIMTVGYKVPRFPECFEPEWVKSYSAEDRERELLEYVKTTVETLKGYENIKIWQVENEPFWPFGICKVSTRETIVKEINTVKMLDNRPILVQDSGEGGFWFATYSLGDKLGISMYRKIWYDFWGIFFGKFIYFQYPLAHWTYKIKADLMGVPYENVLVTELQAEPWGPGLNSELSQTDIDKSMSHHYFIDTLNYAQKGGFKDLYFWGAEWWLYMKDHRNDSFYWDTAKSIIINN